MIFRLSRALIRVSGPDTRGFLHNLLTQDMEGAPDRPLRYAALLTPQGKVIADLLAWSVDGGVILEVAPQHAEPLLTKLRQFKLRAAVEIEAIPGAVLWSSAHPAAAGWEIDPRLPAGGLGARALSRGPAAAAPDGEEAFAAGRLAAGVPELAQDAKPEEVFALEALLEELNGVDFQKGCFPGQENVSRMKRRATTRRKFCPLLFDGPPPPWGAPVFAGEVEIGQTRTAAPGRALALLRLDRALEPGAPPLRLDDGRAARLDPPPWLLLPSQAGA